MDGRIFSLKSAVEERIQDDWTVEEMAALVGLSAPHFHRLFKASLTVTPNIWLRQLRLAKARFLLETTFEQVNQIAISVGIRDGAGFTRDFRREYGVTPSEYRKAFWNRQQSPPPVTLADNRFRQELIVFA